MSKLHLLLVAISGISFGTCLYILVNHSAKKLVQPQCETLHSENQLTVVEFLMIIKHGNKEWWWNSYKCRSLTLICIKKHMPCNIQYYMLGIFGDLTMSANKSWSFKDKPWWILQYICNGFNSSCKALKIHIGPGIGRLCTFFRWPCHSCIYGSSACIFSWTLCETTRLGFLSQPFSVWH